MSKIITLALELSAPHAALRSLLWSAPRSGSGGSSGLGVQQRRVVPAACTIWG
jgi:hypothetical protein